MSREDHPSQGRRRGELAAVPDQETAGTGPAGVDRLEQRLAELTARLDQLEHLTVEDITSATSLAARTRR